LRRVAELFLVSILLMEACDHQTKGAGDAHRVTASR
jgi:hypothetical protein